MACYLAAPWGHRAVLSWLLFWSRNLPTLCKSRTSQTYHRQHVRIWSVWCDVPVGRSEWTDHYQQPNHDNSTWPWFFFSIQHEVKPFYERRISSLYIKMMHSLIKWKVSARRKTYIQISHFSSQDHYTANPFGWTMVWEITWNLSNWSSLRWKYTQEANARSPLA
jgi:hypothetical protein